MNVTAVTCCHRDGTEHPIKPDADGLYGMCGLAEQDRIREDERARCIAELREQLATEESWGFSEAAHGLRIALRRLELQPYAVSLAMSGSPQEEKP